MTAFFMEPWQPLHRNAIIAESGRFCYACKDRKGSDCSSLSDVHIFDSEYAYRIVNILHSLVRHESIVNGQRKKAEFEFIDERKQRT